MKQVEDGNFCALADDPRMFARSVIRILEDSAFAGESPA